MLSAFPDLFLEVLNLIIEGEQPRHGDLLLLRDYILSGSQHDDIYEPLDRGQQLHTLTMEVCMHACICVSVRAGYLLKRVSSVHLWVLACACNVGILSWAMTSLQCGPSFGWPVLWSDLTSIKHCTAARIITSAVRTK